MSAVNAYLLSHRPDDADSSYWIAPRIHCADGFSLSVQVHQGACCSPRDGIGPDWFRAEIGYPSARPSDEVMAYAEEPDCPTDTVYRYVPMDVIDRLVADHGGITEKQCVDVLEVIRGHAESHRALSGSDAYSAQEAPKLEAALDAVAELIEALDDVIGWVPGPAAFHTDVPAKAVARARKALKQARGGA